MRVILKIAMREREFVCGNRRCAPAPRWNSHAGTRPSMDTAHFENYIARNDDHDRRADPDKDRQ
jgi:hypothetical protein